MSKLNRVLVLLTVFAFIFTLNSVVISAEEKTHETDAETHAAAEAHGEGGEAGEHGEGDHDVHYSILHFIVKLFPQIPQPMKWKQPDLIPNTYFIVLLLSILAIVGTRKLQRVPESGFQNFLEYVVESLGGFFRGVLGESGEKYAPYVCSFFIFILSLNMLGLVPGFQAPTADLNTTLALGITAILGVQIIAIREIGFTGYIKHLMGEPIWLFPLQFPIHVVGELSRALSLSIRLFGNVFGEETVMLQLVAYGAILLPIAGKIPWVPAQLPMMFFGLLFGFIQALVFSLLTAIYIVTFVEHHDEEHEAAH